MQIASWAAGALTLRLREMKLSTRGEGTPPTSAFLFRPFLSIDRIRRRERRTLERQPVADHPGVAGVGQFFHQRRRELRLGFRVSRIRGYVAHLVRILAQIVEFLPGPPTEAALEKPLSLRIGAIRDDPHLRRTLVHIREANTIVLLHG